MKNYHSLHIFSTSELIVLFNSKGSDFKYGRVVFFLVLVVETVKMSLPDFGSRIMLLEHLIQHMFGTRNGFWNRIYGDVMDKTLWKVALYFGTNFLENY